MELLQPLLVHVFANTTIVALFAVIYLQLVLFDQYSWTLLWGFITSQALHSSKASVMGVISYLSREDARPLLSVVWELITVPQQRLKAQGKLTHAAKAPVIVGSAFEWCIEVFALVGLMSLASRLFSIRLMVAAMLVFLIIMGALYALDRRIFAYRKVVSDSVVASAVVILSFCASVTFIVLFLGVESMLEGINAARNISRWAQSTVKDEASENEWGEHVLAGTTAITQEAVDWLTSRYNETEWFLPARDAITHYFEHGTLPPDVALGGSKPLSGEGAWGMEGFTGTLTSLLEHLSGLDISMDLVMDYGGASGKVMANGAIVLVAICNFFVVFGFKVVLFFTSALYMTSNDDFLEQNIGVLLPMPKEDRQTAMKMLRDALQGVFFLPFKVACLHGAATLLSFTLLRIQFPFFAAFLTFVVSILPVVPAYVVCWPWAVTLVLHGRWVGLILAISQYLLLSSIDAELCAQGVKGANPYMTGLSSFLGFAAFGAQGVLLGPLIICSATLMYKILVLFGSSFQDAGASARRTSFEDVLGSRPDPVPSESGSKEHGHNGSSGESVDGSKECGARAIQEPTEVSSGRVFGEQRSDPVHEKMDRCQDTVLFDHTGSVSGEPDGMHITRSRIRVQLRVKACSSTTEERADDVDSKHELPSTTMDTQVGRRSLHDDTWRLDIKPSWTWEEFLSVVQDVLEVPGVSGVYGKDGSRIRRVSFIDHGEILDVVPCEKEGKPKGIEQAM